MKWNDELPHELIEQMRQEARALAEQTATPELVITDRLSEDGFWYL